MEKLAKETEEIMVERFGGDSLIALATAANNIPYVRNVNSYYENGAFYVLTYGVSDKMKQIAVNPVVAVAGEWFSAHGRGVNLGWFGSPENAPIADKMRTVFAGWINNGHNNFEDRNTVILRIDLTDGVLFSHGRRFDIDFTK
ncbi:MAG: pyridoxamine 5'-phosphate oxidase family protein [Ruminiclostridium sp.]